MEAVLQSLDCEAWVARSAHQHCRYPALGTEHPVRLATVKDPPHDAGC